MKELKYAIEEAETPKWEMFFGNNNYTVEDHGVGAGGLVSFKKHLRKPLSPKLWVDLTMRLRIKRMRIYRPGSFCWLDCPVGAIITLNEDDNVVDIQINL
ncbi:MAG: hypothetical protein HC888_00190 [Candidatus Competibacteraceae bacterium]|nr:hypothetical protein [Candidatus Competibacteraceae bacterium]